MDLHFDHNRLIVGMFFSGLFLNDHQHALRFIKYSKLGHASSRVATRARCTRTLSLSLSLSFKLAGDHGCAIGGRGGWVGEGGGDRSAGSPHQLTCL